METFARFGTRLDENTQKIIDHGKRIRSCLKQNELQPMSIPEQITVLLALTNGLFDDIPIDKIKEAEATLLKNSKELPSDIIKRLFSDKPLSDQDHDIILKVAGELIAPFKDKPQPDQNKQ